MFAFGHVQGCSWFADCCGMPSFGQQPAAMAAQVNAPPGMQFSGVVDANRKPPGGRPGSGTWTGIGRRGGPAFRRYAGVTRTLPLEPGMVTKR